MPITPKTGSLFHAETQPLAKLCCYVLADYMRDAERGCFPSVLTLMKDTGLSNTSIARHIRAAIDAGLLVRQRFRDRAGHCAGTNYYPLIPGTTVIEEPEDPATLGAETFFELPDPASESKSGPTSARPDSPWARAPILKSLNEPRVQREIETVPALTALTNKSLLEGSKRKLQQPEKPDVQFGRSHGSGDNQRLPNKNRLGREMDSASADEIDVAFLAWIDTARKLAIPAYASRLTVGRRSLLSRTLSQAGGLAAWRVILERLARARFLLGQGKRGFWISFEALCSENIRVRLLEGAYDHVPGASEAEKPVTVSQVPAARWRERLRIWRESGGLAEAWPASWGPPPGASGCQTPDECLMGVQP